MPKKKRWVVRVTFDSLDQVNDTPFIECLRYAGLIEVHDESDKVFDIRCPDHAGLDSQAWAQQNAERMTSFRYNAVAAPAWEA